MHQLYFKTLLLDLQDRVATSGGAFGDALHLMFFFETLHQNQCPPLGAPLLKPEPPYPLPHQLNNKPHH